MKSSASDIKRILIVEDEPVIRQVCQRTLAGEGFEVDIAANGKVAQQMLGRENYDLFIIDIRTPVMDGRQLFQYMEEKRPELVDRVIITSGDLASGDAQSFVERANRPFLPKPFTNDELKALVRETLAQIEK